MLPVRLQFHCISQMTGGRLLVTEEQLEQLKNA